MSIWEEEWEDYEMDKSDFECWLDSLEGDGTDEEKYNEACKEQVYPVIRPLIDEEIKF
tara:strand:+ start:675 stop:848 length:174 start_codon:yes stop_codon:yes gene_type:complete